MNKQDRLRAFYRQTSSYGSAIREGSITNMSITEAPTTLPDASPAPVVASPTAPPAPSLFSAPSVTVNTPPPVTQLVSGMPARTPASEPPVIMDNSLVVPPEAFVQPASTMTPVSVFPNLNPTTPVVDRSIPVFPASPLHESQTKAAEAPAVEDVATKTEKSDDDSELEKSGGKRKRRRRHAADNLSAEDLEVE